MQGSTVWCLLQMRKPPRLKLTYKEAVPRQSTQVCPKNIFDKIFGHPFMREYFRKWSGHGLVPVALGAAVIIEGHLAIQIRAVAVLLCALWLSVDIAIAISEKNWIPAVKHVACSFLTCLCFCAAMWVMQWFLLSVLENQRVDAQKNVKVTMFLPASGNIFKSGVTVSNDSGNDIGGHEIRCKVRKIILDDDVVINGLNKATFLKYTAPIRANGDSETSYCLDGFDSPFKPVCGDVTVDFQYSLTTQEDIKESKQLRFVGKYEGSNFVWRGQNVDYPDTYCKLASVVMPRLGPSQ